jgi:hypothetical protein
LRNLRVEPTALRGPAGELPADRMKVASVHCWPQITEKWAKGEYMVVPELLRPQGRHGETWLLADSTRQFWITLQSPEDLPAGTYRGSVRLMADNAEPPDMDLTVEVLPFRLRWPKPMTLGIYYRFLREKGDERILADLRDMRSNGLNSLAFNLQSGPPTGGGEPAWDLEHLRWAMGLLRRAGGFTGPFPLYLTSAYSKEPVDAGKRTLLRKLVLFLEAERKRQGWPEILYYFVDEPFGGDKLEYAVPHYGAAAGIEGIRTYCTVSREAAERMASSLDVRCHTLTASNGFVWPEVYESARRDGDEFWWYSNATRHYPAVMRMKAGFFHWKVRATGQTYWHYQSSGSTYFCDFERGVRDHAAVYPGLDGPIRTVQWECHREGLDDARYAYVLEALVAEAEKAGTSSAAVATAREVLDGLRKRINVDMESYDRKYPFRKYAFHYFSEWPAEQYGAERNRLIDTILALRKAMGR